MKINKKTIYKQANEWLFKELSLHDLHCEYTEDICEYGEIEYQFPDFYIKECPEWRFGIWYEDVKNIVSTTFIKGTFFCMYEESIDKFKPSRAEYNLSFGVMIDDILNDRHDDEWNLFSIIKMIDGIRKHPIKAFCRDYCGWNYNLENHNIFSQYFQYFKFKFGQAKHQVITEKLDGYVLTYVEESILPLLEEKGFHPVLHEFEDLLPRYSIQCDIEGTELEDTMETGCYDLFEDVDIEFKENWNYLLDRCNRMANFWKVLWYNPVDECIMVYKHSDFEKDEE